MARVPLETVIRDRSGNAVASASVFLYERGTTTPVTVYNASSGGSTISQPLTSGAEGTFANHWVEPGSYDFYYAADVVSPTTPVELISGTDSASVQQVESLLYNVLAYGATGDGVADDTAEIQAAIDAAEAAGGGVVFFPEGTYKTTAPLIQPGKIILRGAGWSSVIKGAAGANPIIEGEGLSSTGLMEGAAIEDLKIDGTSAATGNTGIYWIKQEATGTVRAGRNNLIKSVQVTKCAIGLWLVNDQGVTVTASQMYQNGIGCKISDNTGTGAFYNTDFRNNDTIGLEIIGTTTELEQGTPSVPGIMHFSRCHYESNLGKGVVIDRSGGNSFVTCKWEANADTFLEINDDSDPGTDRPDGNMFLNCGWNNPGPGIKQIHIEKGAYTMFVGGGATGSTSDGVVVDATPNQTMFIGFVCAVANMHDSSTLSLKLMPGLDMHIDTNDDLTLRDNLLLGDSTGGYYMQGVEIADPSAPTANMGRLYFKDVGGKTALMCRFNTGAVQQIAIEP